LDVTGQMQLTPGLILDGLFDAALEVVWVDEQAYADEHQRGQRNQHAQNDPRQLECTHWLPSVKGPLILADRAQPTRKRARESYTERCQQLATVLHAVPQSAWSAAPVPGKLNSPWVWKCVLLKLELLSFPVIS